MKKFFIHDKIESTRTESDFFQMKDKDIGEFILSEDAYLEMQNNFRNYNNNFFMGCASITAKNNREDVKTLWLVNRNEKIPPYFRNLKTHYFEDYSNYVINHSQKSNALIEALALKAIRQPFEKNKFIVNDIRISEIVDDAELNTWLKYLINNGLIHEDNNEFINTINNQNMTANPFNHYFRLTPKAWSEIESRKKIINPKRAFIAMAFNLPNRDEVQKAIEVACLKSDIIAKTVDAEHYSGKITDKIISMINESLIVIADFTSNNNGVYFEAGYAEGLNRIIVYTIKKEDLNNLHFDTKQTNYIIWDTPKDLEEKLTDRIKVLIKKSQTTVNHI